MSSIESLYEALSANMLCTPLHLVPVDANDDDVPPFEYNQDLHQLRWRLILFTDDHAEIEITTPEAHEAVRYGAKALYARAKESGDVEVINRVRDLLKPYDSVIHPN